MRHETEIFHEIEVSKKSGALKVKENCPRCYGRGIEGWNGDEPILCQCVKIDKWKLLKQNNGLLQA